MVRSVDIERRVRRTTTGRTLVGVAAFALLAAGSGCGLAPKATESASGGPDQAWHNEAGEGPTPDPTGKSEPGARPAAIPDDVPKQLEQYYDQRLEWRTCGLTSEQQCSTLRVPLDYDDPDGETLELAVLRAPATNPDERIGSLVLNPGGPGGSGVEYASYSVTQVSAPVREKYDMVGFDPRGVGQSSPVDCVTDSEMDTFLAADASPDTDAERQRLNELGENFAEGCEERTGELLEHVSTEEAARDMDILRGALGDPELYYLGKSYGTYLGATYAELFPTRVGRAVLDGALPPDITSQQLGLGQARGFERALRAFMEDCVQQEYCPLGESVDEAYDTFDQLMARLDSSPLPGDGSRELTQSLAMSGVISPLYLKSMWGGLRSALDQALNGNGAALLASADMYSGRKDGHYRDNSGEAILAVNCLDRPDLSSVDEALAQEDEYEAASPRFGTSILWGSLPCASWPVDPVTEPHEIHASGSQPILVLGTTRDPATPYEWSVRLAEQLESGVLVTRDGDGHTAYMDIDGSECVDSAVDTYLLEGRTPEGNLDCSGR